MSSREIRPRRAVTFSLYIHRSYTIYACDISINLLGFLILNLSIRRPIRYFVIRVKLYFGDLYVCSFHADTFQLIKFSPQVKRPTSCLQSILLLPHPHIQPSPSETRRASCTGIRLIRAVIFLHILPSEINGSIVGVTTLHSQRNLRGLPWVFSRRPLTSYGVIIFHGRKALHASSWNRWTHCKPYGHITPTYVFPIPRRNISVYIRKTVTSARSIYQMPKTPTTDNVPIATASVDPESSTRASGEEI